MGDLIFLVGNAIFDGRLIFALLVVLWFGLVLYDLKRRHNNNGIKGFEGYAIYAAPDLLVLFAFLLAKTLGHSDMDVGTIVALCVVSKAVRWAIKYA